MGNYSSSWSSQQLQDSAGELSDVSLSTEEETMEARDLTLNDLPSEVWACVIAFLPFREKISLSCVNRRMRKLVLQEIIVALKKHTNEEPRYSLCFDNSRRELHLHRRIVSAKAGSCLTVSQAGLVLQLESYRADLREEARTEAESSSGRDWWSLITAGGPAEQRRRQVTIKTCQQLERLERLQEERYDHLRLLKVCLEGQEGLIRGYCQHDYKPISDYLAHLPPSLRCLEIAPGLLYLVSSYQNDLMGNGAIFTAITRTCPLLDTLHMYFDTCKVSSYYRDHGVLGLDGFSGLTEFKFGGVWNSVSQEEFRAFVQRNPTLQIIDLNLDLNPVANNILLGKTNLQIVRLRCSSRIQLVEDPLFNSVSKPHRIILGHCKKLVKIFGWFQKQPSLKYLCIECDVSNSIQQLLESLPFLKDLRILQLDEAQGFNEENFHKILEVLPSLEVLGLPRGFRPHEDFWLSLLDTRYGTQLREITFKLVKCSYRLPANIDLIINALPVKLTLLEVD